MPRARDSLELVDGRGVREAKARLGGNDEGECLPDAVAGLAGPLGRPLGNSRPLARHLPRVREVELEADVETERPRQLQCPLEQRRSRPIVAPPERTPAGVGKTRAGPLGESRVGLSELGPVASRLLQVKAEDLVQLDQVATSLFQPGGEALVQPGSRRLGECAVGGVSDQEVAEAEGVVSGELGLVGADQVLANEGREARRHLAAVRERLDCAAVEDLALDRASLQHGALHALELVESRGKNGLQGRRYDELALGGRGHRHHLCDEQGVPAGGAGDLLAQVACEALRDQLVDVCLRQRLEPERDRPLRTALGELGSSETEDQDRRRGRKQGDVLDQVQERLLSPLDVVEHADEPRLLLEQLAEGPGDLLGRSPLLRLAKQGAQRGSGRRIRGQRVELLDHLDHRPVRDPLAVRKAAAADALCIDRGEKLGRQPRLADAGIADHGHELAASLFADLLPDLPQRLELPHPPDEQSLVPALGRLVDRHQPVGGHRLALSLQLERLHSFRDDRLTDER